MNSRPLTYIQTDGEGLEALTPNHFLLGSSSGVKPIGIMTDDPGVLKHDWKRQQLVMSIFWKRWTNEYLPEISRRTKWYDKVDPLKVGDVVAVINSDVPYSWQLGKVEHVIRSKDGNVRQADVRTSNGILRRPASKLAILINEQIELRECSISSASGSVMNAEEGRVSGLAVPSYKNNLV